MSSTPTPPGQIIILNGAPHAGQSTIAAAIQDSFDGLSLDLGVDRSMQMTTARYRPALGLRPAASGRISEPVVASSSAAPYPSIAAHSRLGMTSSSTWAPTTAYFCSPPRPRRLRPRMLDKPPRPARRRPLSRST